MDRIYSSHGESTAVQPQRCNLLLSEPWKCKESGFNFYFEVGHFKLVPLSSPVVQSKQNHVDYYASRILVKENLWFNIGFFFKPWSHTLSSQNQN